MCSVNCRPSQIDIAIQNTLFADMYSVIIIVFLTAHFNLFFVIKLLFLIILNDIQTDLYKHLYFSLLT